MKYKCNNLSPIIFIYNIVEKILLKFVEFPLLFIYLPNDLRKKLIQNCRTFPDFTKNVRSRLEDNICLRNKYISYMFETLITVKNNEFLYEFKELYSDPLFRMKIDLGKRLDEYLVKAAQVNNYEVIYELLRLNVTRDTLLKFARFLRIKCKNPKEIDYDNIYTHTSPLVTCYSFVQFLIRVDIKMNKIL